MSTVKGSSEKDNNKYVVIRLKHSNVELLKALFHLFCTTNTTRTKPMYSLHLINVFGSGFLRKRDTQSMSHVLIYRTRDILAGPTTFH